MDLKGKTQRNDATLKSKINLEISKKKKKKEGERNTEWYKGQQRKWQSQAGSVKIRWVMEKAEQKEEGWRLCEAGNTQQRLGGCLDRCRLPLGSPRSSINRPPHNPALPTVGEICPETHGAALASKKEGGKERRSGWWEAGRMGTQPLADPHKIYTQLTLNSGPISSCCLQWCKCITLEAIVVAPMS